MLRLQHIPACRFPRLNQVRFQSTDGHKYSSTVFLPQTSFNSRSDGKLIESTLKPQTTSDLYSWNIQRKLKDEDIKNLFILHDGPPYANGALHVGHALNKVLKDVITRYELIQGKKVHYVPGWDCHGLPIELKTLEKLGKERKEEEKNIKKKMKKLNKTSSEYLDLESQLKSLKSTKLSPLDIIASSTAHAQLTQKSQSESFQELAIMGDFNNPYMTLDKSFVVDQLKVFKKFFDNGLVHRQKKPVYWGCENATALAEGELEYNANHVSKTSFVKFPIGKLSDNLSEKLGNYKNDLSALIWTSTPWTLASNLAISLNKNLEYTILKHGKFGNLIVAKELVDSIIALQPDNFTITNVKFLGSELLGSSYYSPLLDNNVEYPFLHGEHVTSTAGTGLVHTAPGHGHDDYLVCLKNNILPFSPVDQYGKYSSEIAPALSDFVGLKVLTEGNDLMIKKIIDLGICVHLNDKYVHSYPYDWRSKKPIIIRATSQWFIDVSKIKEKTTKALIENVQFYPERGSKRLVSFINTRNEWCISRQRSWGVPIPVLYHKETGEALLDDLVIQKITNVIEKEDVPAWFEPVSSPEDMKKWLPEKYHHVASNYIKGTDTMDVWFDSGSSWNTVENYLSKEGLLKQAEERGYISDVYLEGSDQHRGWFQSSILTKVGTGILGQNEVAPVLPYKKIITHGFTLDERGDKMSKSIGNTILPTDILEGNKSLNIPKLGIDGLRLWVAQSDYFTDVVVGPTVLKHVGDNLKKIRFTFRFLLGNLPLKNFESVEYNQLSGLDKYVLHELALLEKDVKSSYEVYNFSKVVKSINQFINVTLSSIYFDVRKDCLYTDSLTSSKRMGTLTVFSEVLKSLLSMLSPILPIMTQEVWNNLPQFMKGEKIFSPFQSGWYKSSYAQPNHVVEEDFKKLMQLRSSVKQLLDKAVREDKVVKNTLETEVWVKEWDMTSYLDDMADFLVVSGFKVGNAPDGKYRYQDTDNSIIVKDSDAAKCGRCWKYTATESDICIRCKDVLREMNQ
ncbi:isoleucine--tRNA ligase [Martiniozyma asiatica (nom. inval.)]|nr:isoleucine--tRNA ligase [Martiniozyma asiatica]